jgi:hypothetical protein
MWRWFIVWGSTLACAALTWTIWPTSPIGLCLVSFAAIVGHSLTVMLYDGLARARERAYLHPKVKAGTLKEADLPAALVRFPARSIAITFMLYASIPLLLYGSMVIEDLWLIFAAIWVGLPIILVGVSFFTLFKLVLWIFMHTGETAFTAAEALRRRKLKETIYADSNGDPLEVSDLRGDVSVGNDGEIEMGVRGKYDDGST